MTICIKFLIKNMNIVVGCSIGCSYCYARNNCRRFHITDDFSVPEYMVRKLRIIDTPKPHVWLMTGMSDFSDWKPEWNAEIFRRMKSNPQHAYIFLTKCPDKISFSTDDENVWMGVTVTRNSEKKRLDDLKRNIKAKHYHVTFEPIFDENRRYRFRGYRLDCHRYGDRTSERQSGFPSRMGASHCRPSPNTGRPRVYERGFAAYNGRRKDDSGTAGTIYKTLTMNTEIIKEIDVQSVMTKSSLPVGGYSVNPYVGCPHACKYCYASFMKRFTGHTEPWGAFLDVKNWKPIANPHKYDGERIVIGSVTDGYNPYEEQFCRTHRLLEELRGSNAEIMICTKSDLVLRDLDLLKRFPKVTVSWSVNTLDERFRTDMDNAVSIERRLNAMRQVYEAGIRTVCFVSPIFPGITDMKAIIEKVKGYADLIWLENLNLRGQFKGGIMTYIREKHPDLFPLYEEIYNKKRLDYWQALEQDISQYAKAQGFPYRINDLPYGRSEKGKPVIVNYFYHEKIRLTK